MSQTISINKRCEKCGSDEWIFIDETNLYKQFCSHCGNYIEIIKIDYLKKFQCSECNCLEGTIEENDNFLAVRCKHCGKQTIMLEKHTTENRRVVGEKPSTPKTYEEIKQSNQPKCPMCGSTRIQKISGSRKLMGAIGFGLLSKTAKSQFECLNCKYKW